MVFRFVCTHFTVIFFYCVNSACFIVVAFVICCLLSTAICAHTIMKQIFFFNLFQKRFTFCCSCCLPQLIIKKTSMPWINDWEWISRWTSDRYTCSYINVYPSMLLSTVFCFFFAIRFHHAWNLLHIVCLIE